MDIPPASEHFAIIESECHEQVYKTLDRQAYDIEERAFHIFNAHISYPLLYAIGSGFVIRLVMRDVISNHVFRKFCKFYFGHHTLAFKTLLCSYRESRNHLVLAST